VAFRAAIKAGRSRVKAQPSEALRYFRHALTLWRGEPLPEDTYAAWTQADRRLLTREFLEALEGAAATSLLVGDPAEAVACAELAVAREPLRESAVMLLVESLMAGGNQAQALAAFDSFRHRLAAETGLDPSPAAQAVRQRVLLAQPPAPRSPTLSDGPVAVDIGVVIGSEGVVADGLVRLPALQLQLARLLAVLERPASPALLCGASGRPVSEVLADLEALDRARVARAGTEGWELRDETVSRGVLMALDLSERARAHGLLASAMQHAETDPAELARHLQGSGDREAAAAAYLEAAESRLESSGTGDAMRLTEAGLSLKPVGGVRAALLRTRAEVHRRCGRLTAAEADLASALGSARSGAERSRMLAELAVIKARSEDLRVGEQLIDLAIGEAGSDSAALSQALAAGAIMDLPSGNLSRARRRIRRAEQLQEQAGDRQAAAWRLYCQAMASYFGGRLREAVTRLGQLATLPARPADLFRFWCPQATLGHVLTFLGEAGAGLDEISQALSRARAAGYPALEAECLWRSSEALASLGRAGQAADAAQEAVAIASRIGHAACLSAALRGLGIACEADGDPDRAEVAFRRSLLAAAGNAFFAAWNSARLGACLARQGRSQDAAEYVRAALAGGTPLTSYEARWAHAELLAVRGDASAHSVAADALQAAEHNGYLVVVPRLRELAGY